MLVPTEKTYGGMKGSDVESVWDGRTEYKWALRVQRWPFFLSFCVLIELHICLAYVHYNSERVQYPIYDDRDHFRRLKLNLCWLVVCLKSSLQAYPY